MLQVAVLMAMLLATRRVFGANAEEENIGMIDTKQLLSEQPTERSQALEGLTAEYYEVSAALLKTLKEAKAEFRADRRYHSEVTPIFWTLSAWRPAGSSPPIFT